jgi:hypothetical protein
MKELKKVQEELKVPKGQFNSFSNFYYRSCEDILEAVKPLLKKEGLFLTISDELVNIGERYYIKAIASVKNEAGEEVVVTGYAREEETKKGMDGSQITGSSSSYARKYALNGMFLIDDGKDADSMDNRDNETKVADIKMVTMKQGKLLQSLGMEREDIKKLTSKEASSKIKELTGNE